jgi:hypothetical protein
MASKLNYVEIRCDDPVRKLRVPLPPDFASLLLIISRVIGKSANFKVESQYRIAYRD